MSKKYKWAFDDRINENTYCKYINDCLSKEFGAPSEDFGNINCMYYYYAFDGEYEAYCRSLGMFIDNFNVYGKAKSIVEDFKRNAHYKTMKDYLFEEYFPSVEVLGGDMITSGEYRE